MSDLFLFNKIYRVYPVREGQGEKGILSLGSGNVREFEKKSEKILKIRSGKKNGNKEIKVLSFIILTLFKL